MSICGYEFFSLWLGQSFADKTYYIVIIQAVTFGTMAIGIIAWQIMEGLGNTRNNALVSIPWAALSLILMLLHFVFQIRRRRTRTNARLHAAFLIYIFLCRKKSFWQRFMGILEKGYIFIFHACFISRKLRISFRCIIL